METQYQSQAQSLIQALLSASHNKTTKNLNPTKCQVFLQSKLIYQFGYIYQERFQSSQANQNSESIGRLQATYALTPQEIPRILRSHSNHLIFLTYNAPIYINTQPSAFLLLHCFNYSSKSSIHSPHLINKTWTVLSAHRTWQVVSGHRAIFVLLLFLIPRRIISLL